MHDIASHYYAITKQDKCKGRIGVNRKEIHYQKRMATFGILLALLMGVVYCNSKLPPKELPADTVSAASFVKGVWINYLEYGEMISDKSEEEFRRTAKQVLTDLQQVGINTVFLHLRSHSDSLYPSSLFPWSSYVNGGTGTSFDPTGIFIEIAHKMGFYVHAWLNPYRISGKTLAELSQHNPAYAMREDGNCVVQTDDGVYYNPASPKVRSLILDGVREILETYPVDGIQYDDYFYPTTVDTFDRVAYQQYCDAATTPLKLDDWRRCQVNLLISGTYQLTQQYKVVFGVSPAADIDKNYHTLYADVKNWVKGGYVDYLCPQLYFGFDYPDEKFRFGNLLQAWENLAESIPLYIGIASYKVGTEDAGSKEWITATDVLARETELVASSQVADGVCIYHYSSLMKQDDLSTTQREALQNVLSAIS